MVVFIIVLKLSEVQNEF